MRLKDLRWHILFSVILLISYAAIAICFYLSISSGKVESSMKELGLEKSSASVDLFNETVTSYYNIYLNGNLDKIDECKSQTGLAEKFNSIEDGKPKVIIAQANLFESNVSSSLKQDTEFYIYFYNNKTVSRIKLKDLLDELFSDQIWYAFNLNETRDKMISNNSTDNTEYTKNIESLIGTASKNEALKNGYFNEVLNLSRGRGVLSGNKTISGDLYIAFFISTSDAYLGISWVLTQAIIFYSAGVIVCILMLLIFILGCKKASTLLRVDRTSTEKTKAMVIRIDPNGNVIFTNRTFKQMYGLTTKLTNVHELIDVMTEEPILETVKKNQSFECSVVTDDGIVHYLHLSPLYISNSYYLMGTEITVDYERRKHLEEMSGKNEVTHCDNGFTLVNQFRTIISNSESTDLAFIQFNIIKHEDVISVFGRKNYCSVQNEFLTKLKEKFDNLAIFQMSEAEFIVIFPNVNLDDSVEIVKSTLEDLKRPFNVERNSIYLNVKTVIYNLKREDFADITLDKIMDKLELALKNIINYAGKDLIVYDPAMDGILLAADEMEKDLEHGLINSEFKMYLQPQFDIMNNRIDGFEALIRWMNPKYNKQSPQTFIELAEERGHMLDIGRFVISESLKLAKKLEPYNVHVSVNVSPVQLLQAGFVQNIVDEFKSLNLKKGSIAIEITETFLMDNFHLMNEKLHLLYDLGFHIHLDDFCTGYSSMLYLKDLPVDTLKIDKEFTKNITTNKTSENIVKTICNLANALNLDMVCEGVETEEQLNMMKKFGCRVIQGYLIGKAMPYEEAVVLLEKYNEKGK